MPKSVISNGEMHWFDDDPLMLPSISKADDLLLIQNALSDLRERVNSLEELRKKIEKLCKIVGDTLEAVEL